MSGKQPIITLTTDFGTSDYYVSAMKAVIISINRDVTIVDVSHEISPQDIMAGSWVLKNTAFLYPENSIHVCVVDPGVGTKRNPIVLQSNNQFFVGPDNGLFSLVADKEKFKAHIISNPDLIRKKPSATFHGRDIFAPAAAHLAAGTPLEFFGPEIPEIVTYKWAEASCTTESIKGWVLHIDRYGNLITNITSKMIKNLESKNVKIYAGTFIINGVVKTFADVDEGEPVAFIGSSGMLEISINKGNASELLGINKGAPVTVFAKKTD